MSPAPLPNYLKSVINDFIEGEAAQTFNPSIQEAEVCKSLRLEFETRQSKFQDSQC